MKNFKASLPFVLSIISIAFLLIAVQFLFHGHPKVTKIKLFQPWMLNSEQLNKQFVIAENLEGNCWTSSNLNARPDAWRCMVGNRVLDPCFSANPTAKTVACSVSPLSKKITLLHLTKELPISQAHVDNFMKQNPWVLNLNHHQACYPIGGATIGFAGMRNNYSCSAKGSLLFGPVDCSQALCKVFYYQANRQGLVQVPVTEIWY